MTSSRLSIAMIKPCKMWARSSALLQLKLRPARRSLRGGARCNGQSISCRFRAGDAPSQGDVVDRETRLKLRVLVQLVQDHIGNGIALELETPRAYHFGLTRLGFQKSPQSSCH